MSKIISFASNQTAGLTKLGIANLHVEVRDDGSVSRELGVSPAGDIVHRHPGLPTVARHGLFDLQTVQADSPSDAISMAQFMALWTG